MKPEFFSCRIYGVLTRGLASGPETRRAALHRGMRCGRGPEVLMTRSIFINREFVNFPGGGIELGESPLEALTREYREETGLLIRPLRVLYASEGLHVSTQRPMHRAREGPVPGALQGGALAPWQIVSLYWLVERTGGDLRSGGNGDDVLNLFWAPLSSIPMEEMFPSDKELALKLPGLLGIRGAKA